MNVTITRLPVDPTEPLSSQVARLERCNQALECALLLATRVAGEGVQQLCNALVEFVDDPEKRLQAGEVVEAVCAMFQAAADDINGPRETAH